MLDDAATQRDAAPHACAYHHDGVAAAAARRTAFGGGRRGGTEPPPADGPPTNFAVAPRLRVRNDAATQRDAALHAPGHDPDEVTAAAARRTASSGGVAATRSRRRPWRPAEVWSQRPTSQIVAPRRLHGPRWGPRGGLMSGPVRYRNSPGIRGFLHWSPFRPKNCAVSEIGSFSKPTYPRG